jgi:hypothetical protein
MLHPALMLARVSSGLRLGKLPARQACSWRGQMLVMMTGRRCSAGPRKGALPGAQSAHARPCLGAGEREGIDRGVRDMQ